MNFYFNKAFSYHDTVKDAVGEVVDFVGQLQPLNILVHDDTFTDLKGAFFSKYDGYWYNYGDAATVASSINQGHTWNVGLVSGVASGEDCVDGVADPATGNWVVATSGRYVFKCVAGAITKVDVYGGAIGADPDISVVWDPIHSKFVWLTSGVGNKVKHSPTGAVWTAGVTSSDWSTTGGYTQMAVNPTSGRIVAIGYWSSTSWAVMYSDDGGATWTDQTHITPTPADCTRQSLVFEAESETWFFTIGDPYASQIYTSTDDGLTWTLATELTTVCLTGVAVDGANMMCAVALSASFFPRLVYSTDQGATWRVTGTTLSLGLTDNAVVASGGGRFMVAMPDDLYVTAAAGNPSLGTVT